LATSTRQSDPTVSVTSSSSRKRLGRRLLRTGIVVVLLSAAAPVCLLLRPLVSSNLGTVDPGRVIRAAQPTTRLPQLIKDHHLASILNLRGGSFKDTWYESEVRTAEANGVAFFDFPLKATTRPTRSELLTLIDFFDHCKYPLLIHCKAGADRTGLASALYLMLQKKVPPQEAIRTFTIYHGHIPLLGTEHLHEPLDEYTQWLDSMGLAHAPARFREWVKKDYRSDDPSSEPSPLFPGPRKPRKPSSYNSTFMRCGFRSAHSRSQS
jgi:protein tyrosine phosphatase (PTP) superfamily phosphohydrolase (DUF442 family)